jgi:hypothetical protein
LIERGRWAQNDRSDKSNKDLKWLLNRAVGDSRNYGTVLGKPRREWRRGWQMLGDREKDHVLAEREEDSLKNWTAKTKVHALVPGDPLSIEQFVS